MPVLAADADVRTLTVAQITSMVDERVLEPDATVDDVWRECTLAADLGLASVKVRLPHVVTAAAALAGSKVTVATILDFPPADATLAQKLAQAERALEQGAAQVAVVVPTGQLRQPSPEAAARELSAIADLTTAAGADLKAVIHTGELTSAQTAAACRAAEDAGVAVLVGGSWFASGTASLLELSLMRRSVGPRMAVKAAGRVRTLDMLLTMHAEGVDRFTAVNTGRLVGQAMERAAWGAIRVPQER